MLAGEEDDGFRELVKMGYFKKINGTICRTDKFIEETGSFIDAKKEPLYEAVKKLGNAQDMGKAMELAGIKDFITFVFVAEELVADGRLVKNKEKNLLLK